MLNKKTQTAVQKPFTATMPAPVPPMPVVEQNSVPVPPMPRLAPAMPVVDQNGGESDERNRVVAVIGNQIWVKAMDIKTLLDTMWVNDTIVDAYLHVIFHYYNFLSIIWLFSLAH